MRIAATASRVGVVVLGVLAAGFPSSGAEPAAGQERPVALRLEATAARSGQAIPIEVYNGHVQSKSGGPAQQFSWDPAAVLRVTVLYRQPVTCRAEGTMLRFQVPGEGFAVAVEDVLSHDAVYVSRPGILVTRDPPPVTASQYLAAAAGRKTVLQRVRRLPDQTLAQAMAITHNPFQDGDPIMLSLANGNDKFVVDHEGGIRGKLAVQFSGNGPAPQVSRGLEDGWRPVPTLDIKQGAVRYRQRVCVAPADDRPPSPSAPGWFRVRAMCVVEGVMENSGKNDAAVRLALELPSAEKQPLELTPVKGGVVATSAGGDLAAFAEIGATDKLKLETKNNRVILAGTLAAKKSVRCYLYFPAWKMAPEQYLDLSGGAQWFDRAKVYWDQIFAPAMQVDLPDAFLSNVIRASQCHCMLAARNEDQGRQVAAWISAESYGCLDSESQAILRGMDLMGHADFARRGLEYWQSRVNPQGFFVNYSLSGVGETLWTLAEHFGRTRDRDWLKKVAPTVVRSCKWISAERRKSMVADAKGQRAPEWGLMPPGTSADWGVQAYRFFNDAQFYAGLQQAAAALAEIGHPDAPALEEDARQYRADILRAYRWNQERSPVLPLANGTWVRGCPSLHRCFGLVDDCFPGQDGGRSWCYSVEVGAHHMALLGLLDPQSRDVTEMIDHLEDVQFLRSGWGDYAAAQNRSDFFNYGGFAKVQPYYCRNAELYALRDDVKPFVRTYFNSLASLISRPYLSIREHFHRGGAWNKTHETGWFLAQTRMMLVAERGDELWLAPMVTNNWLKDGMTLAVKNAPTRFGKVSYTIRSAAAAGRIDATIEPPPGTAAPRIILRIRHPDGKPMRSVTVNGQPHRDFDAQRETVSLAPAAAPIHVSVQY